jgi:hypothetical protein
MCKLQSDGLGGAANEERKITHTHTHPDPSCTEDDSGTFYGNDEGLYVLGVNRSGYREIQVGDVKRSGNIPRLRE